jgi:hypothetical protein
MQDNIMTHTANLSVATLEEVFGEWFDDKWFVVP